MKSSNNLKKRDSFRHLLKSLASMYESSDSQFFGTTTGIQLGPDVFDKSRFVMDFLTILGFKEILCSFRLVLEQKTGKEISESSRINNSGSLNRVGMADWPLLRTLFAKTRENQVSKILCIRRNKYVQKEQDCQNHSLGSKKES